MRTVVVGLPRVRVAIGNSRKFSGARPFRFLDETTSAHRVRNVRKLSRENAMRIKNDNSIRKHVIDSVERFSSTK